MSQKTGCSDGTLFPSNFGCLQVDLLWNKQGTSLLVKTALEVDTTGESYYGEQNLHYISIKGDSAIVTLCE